MNKTTLTLENLKQFDFGSVEAAFKRAVQRVGQDCEDRPGVDKARKINIVFSFVPVTDANSANHLSHIDVQADIVESLPKRVTNVVRANATSKGDLYFHPDLPDEPDGDALYDADVKQRGGKKQE